MVKIILDIVIVAAYFSALIYIIGVIAGVGILIKDSIDEKSFHKQTFHKLLYMIFLGNYGIYRYTENYEANEVDIKERNTAIAISLFMLLGMSIVILPKIGYGTETVGSPFENEKYIGYHYATITELDKNYEPTSVEIFGIAEVDKDEDDREIRNIYIKDYDTIRLYSDESIDIFEAPIVMSDSFDNYYEVKVLKIKPEVKKYEDFYTKVAGVTFDNEDVDIQEILEYMKSHDKTITLIREKDNEYDKDAVRVYSKYGMIGYINNDLAPLIAEQLDYGGIAKATVSEITGGLDGKNYGCNINIEFYYVVEKDNYRPEPDFDDRN